MNEWMNVVGEQWGWKAWRNRSITTNKGKSSLFYDIPLSTSHRAWNLLSSKPSDNLANFWIKYSFQASVMNIFRLNKLSGENRKLDLHGHDFLDQRILRKKRPKKEMLSFKCCSHCLERQLYSIFFIFGMLLLKDLFSLLLHIFCPLSSHRW